MDDTGTTGTTPTLQAALTVGNLSLDIIAQKMTVGGTHVHMTMRQFQMMELLARKPDTVITKEGFLDHLYAGVDEPEHNIIDVYICKIRKTLAGAGSTVRIETVWGRGYKLVVPDTP